MSWSEYLAAIRLLHHPPRAYWRACRGCDIYDLAAWQLFRPGGVRWSYN